MTNIFVCALALVLLANVKAVPRVQLHRGLLSNDFIESSNQPYPYMFTHTPRGRASNYAGYEIAEEADDDAIDYDDDKWVVEKEVIAKPQQVPVKTTHNVNLKNILTSNKAGSILVPDGIIEVEGQTVYDEKTGQSTLIVAKSALDAIPNGSIVALLDTQLPSADNDEAEERANRVLVRRRKKGSKTNLRSGNNRRRSSGKRRSQGGNSKKRSRRPSAQAYNARKTGNRNRSQYANVVPIYLRAY